MIRPFGSEKAAERASDLSQAKNKKRARWVNKEENEVPGNTQSQYMQREKGFI